MNVPKSIFRQYDVRGLVDRELTPEFARALGRAFATVAYNRLGHAPVIAVGRDNRPSGPALSQGIRRGIADAGGAAIDVGTLPTPAVVVPGDLADCASELYMAFELGEKNWKLALGDGVRSPSRYTVAAGDTTALLECIAKAKARCGLAPEASVHSCYEAGRDGFWLHRWLIERGIGETRAALARLAASLTGCQSASCAPRSRTPSPRAMDRRSTSSTRSLRTSRNEPRQAVRASRQVSRRCGVAPSGGRRAMARRARGPSSSRSASSRPSTFRART